MMLSQRLYHVFLSIFLLVMSRINSNGQNFEPHPTALQSWFDIFGKEIKRNIWNEAIFLWSAEENEENEEILLTVSDRRLNDYEFNSSLFAWQTQRDEFEYLSLSCSVNQSCICANYVRPKNANSSSQLEAQHAATWIRSSVAECRQLPPLTSSVFKDFRNVLILEFDRVHFTSIESDVFRPLQSLRFLRLSNFKVTDDQMPLGLFCGLPNLIVWQIYSADFGQNASKDAVLRLFRCTGNSSSNDVYKAYMRVLGVKNCLMPLLGADSFSSTIQGSLLNVILSRNSIVQIDSQTFTGFHNVNDLDISQNKLTTLPPLIFQDLIAMRALNLAFNLLEILDTGIFENLKYLKSLNLSGNQIIDVNGGFDVLPSLVELDLRSNRISYISDRIFTNCVRLGKLCLGGNRFADIHENAFSGTVFLKYLDLSSNLLSNETTVQGFLQYTLEWLQFLDLRDNGLTRLVPYMFKAYTYATKLRVIDLDSNDIEYIDKDAFINLNSLTVISLSRNRLRFLHPGTFSSNVDLVYVFLSYNDLTEIPPSLLPGGIVELYLTDNQLKSVPVFNKTMSRLVILALQGNNLSTIESGAFEQMPALQALNVSNCGLTNISTTAFTNMTNLKILDISSNSLDFDFSVNYFKNSNNINFLNLSNNNIRSAHNLFRHNIRYSSMVDISHNPLVYFPDQPKKDEVGLQIRILTERLIMKNCSLESISPSALDLAFYIGFIDLSFNKMTEFSPLLLSGLIEGYHYQVVLDENPIKCSCKMKWLTEEKFAWHYKVSYCYRTISRTLEAFGSIKQDEFLCMVTEYCTIEPTQCDCYTNATASPPTYLDCINRGVTVFPRNIQSSVKIIHLERNALTRFTKDMVHNNLKNIEELYLDQNFIKEVEPLAFVNFPNLRILSLSGNRIIQLKNGVFSKLKRLEDLRLDNNRIADLDSSVFGEVRLLSLLTLNNNSLSLLTEETREELSSLAYLKNLTLDHNPWSCSCDNATFKYWIQQHSEVISNVSSIICNETTIVTIPDEQLLCYELTRNILNHQYYAGPLLGVCSLFGVLLVMIALIYRYRYLLQVLIYNRFSLRKQQKENESCMYDAIAVYDSSDVTVRKWIKDVLLSHLEPKFQLFIPDRDMLPGCAQTSELAENIVRSRRTLLVLSSDAEQKSEVLFAFEVANHRVRLQKSYHRLLLIFFGNASHKVLLSKNDIDPNLKAYVTTGLYLHTANRFFWEKLNFFLPNRVSANQSQS